MKEFSQIPSRTTSKDIKIVMLIIARKILHWSNLNMHVVKGKKVNSTVSLRLRHTLFREGVSLNSQRPGLVTLASLKQKIRYSVANMQRSAHLSILIGLGQ